MKKRHLAVAAALLSLTETAYAAEFQPLGTLGIGGAGVARQNGALTAYWNPAGGAFNDKSFSFVTGGQFGARGNDGLTQNVDKLSNIDFNSIKNLNGNPTPQAVTNAVELVSILTDIKNKNGNLAITAATPVGFSIKHFSFGIYGNMEGYVQPQPDTVDIVPTNSAGTALSVSQIVANIPQTANRPAATFFSNSQYGQLVGDLTPALGANTASRVVNGLEAQLQSSGLPADAAFVSADKLLNTASGANAGTNTINNNTSSVLTKALLYVEVPLAYGYPIDLGKWGKLGIGAAVKVIQGTVYQNETLLVNNQNGSVKSGDLVKDLTKNKETTTTFGVDLGALWKYEEKLSVGVVAKNLNAPKFDAPTYQKPVPGSTPVAVKGEDVTLDPQVRGGIAYDPYKWLTFAVDMDLTENNAVVPATAVKSRNLGGGLELHPYSWLKVRAGAYKNLSLSQGGPVATAGLSLGPFDLDGAFSTDTFKVGSTTIPQEVKVQLLCGFTF